MSGVMMDGKGSREDVWETNNAIVGEVKSVTRWLHVNNHALRALP